MSGNNKHKDSYLDSALNCEKALSPTSQSSGYIAQSTKPQQPLSNNNSVNIDKSNWPTKLEIYCRILTFSRKYVDKPPEKDWFSVLIYTTEQGIECHTIQVNTFMPPIGTEIVMDIAPKDDTPALYVSLSRLLDSSKTDFLPTNEIIEDKAHASLAKSYSEIKQKTAPNLPTKVAKDLLTLFSPKTSDELLYECPPTLL